MNSKTQSNNLVSILLTTILAIWISTVSVANASVGANPNEYTTKIVMERFDGLKDHMYEASQVSGMDMVTVVAIGSIESTLRTNVKSGASSASGVLQYTKGTWKQDRKLYAEGLGLSQNANVFNPRANLLIGATALSNLKQLLIEKSHLTEETLRVGDLYMSHLVGSTAAIKIINSNSNTPLNKIITITKGNWSMYHKPNGHMRTAREFRLYLDTLVQREGDFYKKEVVRYQVVKNMQAVFDPNNDLETRSSDMALAIANTIKYIGFNNLNS